jgi:DNA-3-methyladenine glycosylase II
VTTHHSDIHELLLQCSSKHHTRIHSLFIQNGPITIEAMPSSMFFEFLARTVVGQQLSAIAARTIWVRVESLANEQKLEIFELFQKNNEESLRLCGISRAKIRAIIELRTSLENNLISASTILASDYEDVVSSITNLWGFGRWSADMCAIFYCGLQDIFPDNDAAIEKGLKKLCGVDVDSESTFHLYTPYRSYLCRHIWHGLDSGYID